MSGLSFEYILRHDNRPPHCSNRPRESRIRDIDNITWAPDYADGEGMDKPAWGILFGNWNNFSRDACDALERAGYSLEWEDEWSTCDDCGKAVRTSPDSYGWQPTYFRSDCGTLCQECVDLEEYLESLEDDPERCCFAWVNPDEHGYVLISKEGEFESGWHPGQNDNPADILRDLHERGIRHVVFRTTSTGQFDINFEAWRKEVV